MRAAVESSRCVKHSKRPIEDIDPDPPPTTKHHRLQPAVSPPTPSPTLSPTPSPFHDRPSQSRSIRKQRRKAALRPEPTSTLKRVREDHHPDYTPASKRLRQPSPTPPLVSSIHDWLSDLRPRRSLSSVTGSETFVVIEKPTSPHISQTRIDQMSQQDGQNLPPGSVASSQSERHSTSSPMFRSGLFRNGIIMDVSGRQKSSEIEELVDTHLRKRRSSPRLEQKERSAFVDQVIKVWDKAEPIVSDLTKSLAFPVERSGIAEGRDTLWSTKPLPSNPKYLFALPAPKSDRHYGYPNGQDFDWTDSEVAVVDHRLARPYTQPTRENLFPFFMIEIKSEATGGTLYVAENQAATSGAHSVHSLLWLRSQADPSRTRSSTDSVVFTATVSQREAVFHVHWFSPKDDKVYMSYLDSFAFMKDLDIQGCRDLVKNILDYGLEVRQPIIRDALKLLHPIPKRWKGARLASVITDVAESFTSDDGRSSKSQRTELEVFRN